MNKKKENNLDKLTFSKCKCCKKILAIDFKDMLPTFESNMMNDMIKQFKDVFNNLCFLCYTPYVKGYFEGSKIGFKMFCGATDTLSYTTRKNISLEKRIEELEEDEK